MIPRPLARYQVGVAVAPDRVAVLAEADRFVVAQAKQIVIARLLLRDGAGPAVPVVVVIVRREDGAVLDRRLVADGGEP